MQSLTGLGFHKSLEPGLRIRFKLPEKSFLAHPLRLMLYVNALASRWPRGINMALSSIRNYWLKFIYSLMEAARVASASEKTPRQN